MAADASGSNLIPVRFPPRTPAAAQAPEARSGFDVEHSAFARLGLSRGRRRGNRTGAIIGIAVMIGARHGLGAGGGLGRVRGGGGYVGYVHQFAFVLVDIQSLPFILSDAVRLTLEILFANCFWSPVCGCAAGTGRSSIGDFVLFPSWKPKPAVNAVGSTRVPRVQFGVPPNCRGKRTMRKTELGWQQSKPAYGFGRDARNYPRDAGAADIIQRLTARTSAFPAESAGPGIIWIPRPWGWIRESPRLPRR